MIVTVRLYAILRRPTPTGYLDRLTVELAEGSTVASLLDCLAIDIPPESLMLMVNKRPAKPEQTLYDKDEVRLFPAIPGGASQFHNIDF